METSDRRYQELMALMAGRGRDRAQNGIGAIFDNHDPGQMESQMESGVVEFTASASRTTGLLMGFRNARQTAVRATPRRHGDLASSRPSRTARATKGILLVEPDPNGARAAQAALRFMGDVETCTEFRAARTRLLHQPPDLLITNLRLRAYNGLHLVHLAAGTHTRHHSLFSFPLTSPSSAAPASIIICAQELCASMWIVEFVKRTITGHMKMPSPKRIDGQR